MEVGFRYVLASHLDVYRQLIDLRLPASLFIIRFERFLNHQLRGYMDIIRAPEYDNVPVLLLCNEQTRTQGERILERDIDSIIVEPFSLEKIASLTGQLLQRSSRNEISHPVWIELGHKTIQGQSQDISSTGMSVASPDPVLLSSFDIRVFIDSNSNPQINDPSVVFEVKVRRKDKDASGNHILGLQILQVRSGPIELLSSRIGVRFNI